MKLLTLNCHSWQEENQLDKIRYLAETINEKNYDIIALQEVSQLIDSEILYSNIKKDNFAILLKQQLNNIGNYDYQFFWDVSHIGYDVYEEGVCIITKLPIKETKSFYISKCEDIKFWKSRKVVKVKIQYKEKEICVYSCHLGWWNDDDESFVDQSNTLLSDIKDEDLSIIMGDFNNNAQIRNEGYDYLLNHRMIDTYNLAKNKDNGITVEGKIAGWDKNKENLRLDLILTNKIIEVEKSNVIFNGLNKEIISDHFGVEIEVHI